MFSLFLQIRLAPFLHCPRGWLLGLQPWVPMLFSFLVGLDWWRELGKDWGQNIGCFGFLPGLSIQASILALKRRPLFHQGSEDAHELSLHSQRPLLLPNLFRSRRNDSSAVVSSGVLCYLPWLSYILPTPQYGALGNQHSDHPKSNVPFLLGPWLRHKHKGATNETMEQDKDSTLHRVTVALLVSMDRKVLSKDLSVIQKLVIASQHEIWTLKIVFILISHHKNSWHGLTWQWDWCGCAVSAVW